MKERQTLVIFWFSLKNEQRKNSGKLRRQNGLRQTKILLPRGKREIKTRPPKIQRLSLSKQGKS